MIKMIGFNRIALAACFSGLFAISMFGQQVPPTQKGTSNESKISDSTGIIPGDIVSIHFFDASELDQVHVRVTDSGEVTLLIVGPVKIGGLTAGEASKVIADTYMNRHLLRNANVAVTLDDASLSSHAVSVFGFIGGSSSVGQFGISIPLLSARPLLAVLAMAGGLNDRASHTVTIQRADPNTKPFKVFLPNDPDVDLANQPMIYPGDTIVVPRAGLVYILGDVGTPHGVVMQEDGNITLMQALSQAGSTLPTAGLKRVMIFRKASGTYQQLPVNVGQMLKGKTPDIQMEAEDVVWVPFSYGKNLLVNGASIVAALGSATTEGIIINH